MLEEVVPLEPVHFFAFQLDCHSAKANRLEREHLLPDLSYFQIESPFAQISLGWNEKGISCSVEVAKPFNNPSFPNLTEGDSVELFFDTRDVKTTGFTTRFCHHFYFLPASIDSNGKETIQAGEISRFRTEDRHPLCDASLLELSSIRGKKTDTLQIYIPSVCLYGYDPQEFDRLGFAYRINRRDGRRQHFSANGSDFAIESQPSLWASLKLCKRSKK